MAHSFADRELVLLFLPQGYTTPQADAIGSGPGFNGNTWLDLARLG